MLNNIPQHRSQDIVLQIENASPHNNGDNDESLVACYEAPTVKIVFQPKNSLDVNVLGLEMFSSIKSLQNQTNATNNDSLICAVAVTLQETGSVSLDKVWLSMQRCFEEEMKRKGGNGYHALHGEKRKLLHSRISCIRLLSAQSMSTIRQPWGFMAQAQFVNRNSLLSFKDLM